LAKPAHGWIKELRRCSAIQGVVGRVGEVRVEVAGLGGRDVSRDNYDRLAGGGVVWVYVVSTLLTHNQHVQTNVKRVNVDKVHSQKAVTSLLRR
jgi:hypothetical protein